MNVSTQWQLAHDAARRYEEILVPVLLRPAAQVLARRAAIRPGESVLDVGCGTGLVARLAAPSAGPRGRVVAVDLNAGMIAVAKSLPAPAGAPIEWHEGSADALPFAEASFDAVLCAQTLQFVPDRAAALREMRRVLKPRGRVAISVWGPLASAPYFVSLIEAVTRELGAQAAAGIQAVFALQDRARLHGLVREAGFGNVDVITETMAVDFSPLAAFIPRHLSATPLAGMIQSMPPATLAAIVDNVMADMAGRDPAALPLDIHIALGAVP